MMGQVVSTILNERQLSGEQRVGVKQNSHKLSVSQYIYRIIANGKAYSSKFIISN